MYYRLKYYYYIYTIINNNNILKQNNMANVNNNFEHFRSDLVTLTDLETIGLQSITESDFYENGKNSQVWDFSVYENCELTGRTKSGVFSSLAKKEFIELTFPEKKFILDKDGNKQLNKGWDPNSNFGTIKITESGYKILEALGLTDEDGQWIY